MTENTKQENSTEEEQATIERLQMISNVIIATTGYTIVLGITCYCLFHNIMKSDMELDLSGELPSDYMV